MYIPENFMEIILLRPAKYNEMEFELEVKFNDDHICRTSVKETEQLGFTFGDTVEVFAKAKIANDQSDELHFITLYLSDAVLDEFVEKIGIANINHIITCKARFVYKTYKQSNFTGTRTEIEEIVGFQLTELLTAEEILSQQEKECREFFESFFNDVDDEN